VRPPETTHHYLIVPGEVYPNDVLMDTVYREVGSVLEKRGYFDAEFEKRDGRTAAAIDYLLRIHYGKRLWLNPTVRWDRITWGNDGLVASKYNMGLMSVPLYDPRVGLSPEEALRTVMMFDALRSGNGTIIGMRSDTASANARQMMNEHVTTDFWGDNELRVARNFYVVVVEAFRFDDVSAMDKKAPCVWTVFIAVPVDEGRKFSEVLRAMLQAATPYFGETTHGLQIQEVPPGKVIIGNTEMVP
jgi:hypothetical protein